MSVNCEICGKELKNTQGLNGHRRFKHQLVSTQNSPAQAVAEQQTSKLEGSPSKVDLLEGRLDILEEQQEEQTEQVEDLTEYHGQSTEQLNEYSRQLDKHTQLLDNHSEQLKRTTATKLSEYETEQDRKIEELRDECRSSVKRIPGIVKDIDEYVTGRLSVVEDENTQLKTTMTELKNAFSEEQTRVKGAISLGDKNETRIGAMEQNIPHIEKELKRLETLARRIPTGEIVCYPEYESDSHSYKEYRKPEGLARPHRASRGLNSESWIDLDAPLD